MPRVLTIGEALGVLHTDGTLASADVLRIGTGGAEANVAIGLARLGIPSGFAGRVGDDGLGRRISDTLVREGVTVLLTTDTSGPTGLLIKERPAPGRTAVTYHRTGSAGSRLNPRDIDALDLGGVELVHLTGITAALSASAAAAIEAMAERARSAGALVSFDVNHRAKLWGAERAAAAYRRLMARADIVFAGAEEAALVAGWKDSPRRLAVALRDLGPREVVIKLGSRGAVALDEETEATMPAVEVDVVDTVGAGDAFAAGYIAARLSATAPHDRLDLAAHTGAAACTAAGDWEGAATRERVAQLRREADGRTPGIADDEPVDR